MAIRTSWKYYNDTKKTIKTVVPRIIYKQINNYLMEIHKMKNYIKTLIALALFKTIGLTAMEPESRLRSRKPKPIISITE